MEFNSSRFITAVGINVFNSVEFRNVFDNGNNPLEVISFNKVNDLLREELSQSSIAFLSKFRIFLKVFSHLNSKQMNQVLSSGILNWHFNNLFFVVNDVGNSIND